MQFGSSTVPLLPLVAVVGAGALVLLVLWGVWRTRRDPTPAPLPVSPPDGRTEQPCTADWTGEAAGGPADPPRPRARTVADAVAEQGADTGPLPVVAAAGGAVAASSRAPRPGRHAAFDDRDAAEDMSAPSDERPDPAALARTGSAPPDGPARGDAVEQPAAVTGAGLAATAAAFRRHPRPYPGPGGMPTSDPAIADAPGSRDDPSIVGDAPAAAGRSGVPRDDDPRTSDPRGGGAGIGDARTVEAGPDRETIEDPSWPVAHLRAVDEEAGEPHGAPAAPGRPDADPGYGPHVASERVDTDPVGDAADPLGDIADPVGDAADPAGDIADPIGDAADPVGDAADPAAADAAGPARPEASGADDDPATPLPPWSVERTVPPAQELPTGDPVDGPTVAATGSPDAGTTAAAGAPEPVSRAVQQALAARAVRRARLRHPDLDDPTGGEQQELPLSVVPSQPPQLSAGDDARDRLLSVLIADPARAVDATLRLDDSQASIDELGDVLRRRRAELAGAVRHLRDCGLDPVQIGRLSGMPVEDVRTILDGEDAR